MVADTPTDGVGVCTHFQPLLPQEAGLKLTHPDDRVDRRRSTGT
jgi:hypothetical protein